MNEHDHNPFELGEIQHGDIMEKRNGDLFAVQKKDGLTNKNGIHQYTHFCLIEWSVL